MSIDLLTFTRKDISDYTGPELANLYNIIAEQLGDNPVKKFSDRKTGLKRVLTAQKQLKAAQSPKDEEGPKGPWLPETPPWPTKAELHNIEEPHVEKLSPADEARALAAGLVNGQKATKVPIPDVDGYKRRTRMNCPPPVDMPTPKGVRRGTKRAKVLALLCRPEGVTWEEILAETSWSYPTAYEGLKLINTYLGYGLSETDSGVLRAHTGNPPA